MHRFPMEHQWVKLSFQQYGVVLFTQLFHGGNFSETIQKVEWYIEKVNSILLHVGENKFVQNTRQHMSEQTSKIITFTDFVKSYLENRKNFLAIEPHGNMEHITHLLIRLISHGDLSQAHALLIHKLYRFHSEFCDILNQIEWKALIPQEIPE